MASYKVYDTKFEKRLGERVAMDTHMTLWTIGEDCFVELADTNLRTECEVGTTQVSYTVPIKVLK